ncbi:MAG TPA: alpha/beta hydrolase [Verrucomicrobiae bacterium]|nr:alpha/beta hydrolase [Verrucomicrobiae bacterium]
MPFATSQIRGPCDAFPGMVSGKKPVTPDFDGVEIHYEPHGTGQVPLMFLHGWGGNCRTWDPILPKLDAAQFRSICVDLRGHGQSGQPAVGYTWTDFTQDVLAVADRERLSRFVPVGFSMGGKLACHLAALHPERIPAQVLVSSAGPGLVPIEREAGLQICRAANDRNKNKLFFGNWFGPRAAKAVVDAYCDTIAATPVDVLMATAEMTLWTSIERVVGNLPLPTLLVMGRSDPVYGEAYQRASVLPYLANAQTASVASGHFIPLECPAILAKLLNEHVPTMIPGSARCGDGMHR